MTDRRQQQALADLLHGLESGVSFDRRPSAFKDTPLLPATTPPVDLMAALDAVQRCLIVGASDSSKTTLLQHIIARRASRSEVMVIDPHASPQKWAAGNVVGLGRDYVKIDRALEALVRHSVSSWPATASE